MVAVADTETLKKQSLEGARMGYTGKQVIHPIQVPIVQDAFSPSQMKVDWATELIKAFEEHQQFGKVRAQYNVLFFCDRIRAGIKKYCNLAIKKINILYHIYCHFSKYSSATSVHFFNFSLGYLCPENRIMIRQLSSVIHHL